MCFFCCCFLLAFQKSSSFCRENEIFKNKKLGPVFNFKKGNKIGPAFNFTNVPKLLVHQTWRVLRVPKTCHFENPLVLIPFCVQKNHPDRYQNCWCTKVASFDSPQIKREYLTKSRSLKGRCNIHVYVPLCVCVCVFLCVRSLNMDKAPKPRNA